MKRPILWLLLLVCALVCDSCVRLPGEEYAFAVVLALDRNEDDRWQAWVRIPSYQTEGNYTTLTASGTNASEAINRLSSAAPMALHYGQLRMVVLGSRLLENNDLEPVLSELTGHYDLRIDAVPVVSQEAMESLMEGMNPVTGKRLSKSLDILTESRILLGVIPDVTLREYLLFGRQTCTTLPNAVLEDGIVTLSGAWSISPGSVKYLFPDQMKLIALMNGQMKRGTLNLDSMRIAFSEANAKITLRGDKAVCKLTLWADERCSPDVVQALETACSQLVSSLYETGHDVLHLSDRAIRMISSMNDKSYSDFIDRLRSIISWTINVSIQNPT